MRIKKLYMKYQLKDIADIYSGVYAPASPIGDIVCLQVKDLLMPHPETSATRIEDAPRLAEYKLRKGDLLFAGKGTTYLCKIFDMDITAVASTTLYSIRLKERTATPEFIRWYLCQPNVIAYFKASQVGSNAPLIHKPVLENLEVIIPDLKTQKLITQLASLQEREEQLLKSIAGKKTLITNQILFNELNK